MLPKEAVSLMAHVELNRIGWWDKGIRELIKAFLWLRNTSLSKDEIFEGIQNEFSTDIEFKRFEKQIAELVDSNQLIFFSSKYKLSDKLYRELDENSKSSTELTEQVKGKFENSISKFDIEIEQDAAEIWNNFNTTFLIPLVRDMGVRVFEIISDDHSVFYNTVHFDKFLNGYASSERPKLRNSIEDFFNPQDTVVRGYVLDYLQAYLLVESNKLDEASIDKIEAAMKRQQTLSVLVDTNFLFYLLKLDGGDYIKTAESLLKLASRSSSKFKMKLYVLPITIKEAQERIVQEIRELSNVKITSPLSKAINYTGLLSGIRQQYFKRISEAKHNIPPDKYFEPYLRSMPSMLRENGVEIFNEKLDSLESRVKSRNFCKNR